MRKIAIAITACILLLGCDAGNELFQLGYSDNLPRSSRHEVIFDWGAFEYAKAAWEAQGITCYTFEVWAHAFPHRIISRITVIDGEIADIYNFPRPQPVRDLPYKCEETGLLFIPGCACPPPTPAFRSGD